MAEVKAEKLRLQSARKREKQKELSSSSATFSFASWLVAFLPTFFFCVWPCLFIDHSRGPVPTRRRTLLLNFHAPNRRQRHLATGASTDTKLHNNDEEEKRREIFTVFNVPLYFDWVHLPIVAIFDSINDERDCTTITTTKESSTVRRSDGSCRCHTRNSDWDEMRTTL